MEAVRDLTEDEIATFHEQGWVHAPGLIPADLAARLFARAQDVMGVDAMLSTGAGGGRRRGCLRRIQGYSPQLSGNVAC